MKLKRIKLGLAAVLGILAISRVAAAGEAYMAASGRPFNGDDPAQYSISDGTVCINFGHTWIVPIPIPTSSGTVTHNLNGNYGNMGAVQAWSFNPNGSAFQGVNFSNFNASISVPAGGTVFFKGIAPANGALLACVRTMVLVN